MRILLAVTDLFSTTGGGQSFYSNVIRAHPDHEFWYFSTTDVDPSSLPSNARTIGVVSTYRDRRGSLNLGHPDLLLEGYSFGGLEGEISYILDLAASCIGRQFDVLDIPDFFAYGALLPDVMRHFGVGIGTTAVSMHGVISTALSDNWNAASAPDLSLRAF